MTPIEFGRRGEQAWGNSHQQRGRNSGSVVRRRQTKSALCLSDQGSYHKIQFLSE
jgi:hypothetical protein